MPDVLMPRLSDTMAEGVLVQWLKNEGDQVQRGDVLAEIETDKATMDLEAYDSGVLTRILVTPGSTVPIGEPLAVIGDESESAATAAQVDGAPPAAPASPAPPAPSDSSAADGSVTATRSPAGPAGSGSQVRTSPLARALARDHGIDLASITGTGPGGRVVRADVEAAISASPAAAPPVPPATSPETSRQPAAPPAAVAPAPRSAAAPAGPEDERVPLTAVRRITAQRMTESASAPHFYLTSVVDVGPLIGLRTELNEQLAPAGPRISVTDLLIRACGIALRTHPQVNSSWGGDHLLRRGRVNVGMAVALDDGLIVPVIRDADRKSITDIAVEAHALAERARAGRLMPDEFTGGTFTISNLGMFGIDHFTAVINPPEAAILAVGAAQDEAVVRDGKVVVASIMKLTLSIDHRVLDGATAAAFQRDLIQMLQRPLRLLA